MYLPSDRTIAFYLKYRRPIRRALRLEVVICILMVLFHGGNLASDLILGFILTFALAMFTVLITAITQQRKGCYLDSLEVAIQQARLDLAALYRRQLVPVAMIGLPAIAAIALTIAAALLGHGAIAGEAIASAIGLIAALVIVIILDVATWAFFSASHGLNQQDEQFLSEIEHRR